jgi:hypothetical protein
LKRREIRYKERNDGEGGKEESKRGRKKRIGM